MTGAAAAAAAAEKLAIAEAFIERLSCSIEVNKDLVGILRSF